MDWQGFLITVVTSSGITSGLNFIFRESIKAKLKKSVEADLARVSHELEVRKEVIKGDLSRDAYKAQLMLNNLHAIYPELATKLEYAYGAVSQLQGPVFAVDLRQYKNDDVKTLLEGRKLPSVQMNDLVAQLEQDRDAGIKAIEKCLRQIDFEKARKKCVDVQNYRVLKAVYCSDKVIEAFESCYKSIWSVWTDLSIGSMDATLWARGSNEIRKVTPEKMDYFRKAVRAELRIDEK